MPNVNLTDSRNRDAVVKAETTGAAEEIRYVDLDGHSAQTRKILKATVEQDFETLVAKHEDDAEALGRALVEGDPEVDMEICGQYLWGVSKVYVDKSDGIVYRIEQREIVRDPDGNVKEKRPRNPAEANVDVEIPLTWTSRKITKAEAVRRFVFGSKLQIVHINGLTYDFLYGMAKELAESDSLMMVGGGSKGRDPLVFRRGSVPYRGFLEGRVDGEKYILLLHLSNLELKVPSARDSKQESSEKKSTTKKTAAKKKAVDNEDVKPEEKETKAAGNKAAKKIATKKKAAAKAKPAEAAAPTDNKPKKGAEEKSTVKSKKKKPAATEGGKSQKDSKEKVVEEPAKKAPVDSTGAKITSDDLGIWLKSIRMGKYLQLFIDNEIDVDVIADLTDNDLKELEIPLGSRRRLLKAVEETDNLHAEIAMAVSAMATKSKKESSKQSK